MIRKMSVRLQKLARRYIRAQRRQNLLRVEPARAVPRVNNDFQTGKRLVRHIRTSDLRNDLLPQMRGIACDQVFFMYAAGFASGFRCGLVTAVVSCARLTPILRAAGSVKVIVQILTLRAVDDVADVLLVQPAIPVKIFEAIAVERQMTGGDHDCAVTTVIFKNGRHKHCRCGRQTAVIDRRADSLQCHKNRRFEAFRAEPAVMSHRYRQVLRRFLQLFTEPKRKAFCQPHRFFLSEIHSLSRDALHRDPADIAAVL